MLNPTDQAVLDAIIANGPDVITEEDAAILRARRSYLSEEQKAVFADALAAAPAETPEVTPDEPEEKPEKKGK